jgi:hypothetical protein
MPATAVGAVAWNRNGKQITSVDNTGYLTVWEGGDAPKAASVVMADGRPTLTSPPSTPSSAVGSTTAASSSTSSTSATTTGTPAPISVTSSSSTSGTIAGAPSVTTVPQHRTTASGTIALPPAAPISP